MPPAPVFDHAATPSFATVHAARPDYGSQFEILVAYLYAHVVTGTQTVVDGGANTGLHARPLSMMLQPGGKLVCFEPVPETCATLRQNLAGSIAAGQTVVHQEALGQKPDELTFLFDHDNPAMSRVLTDYDTPNARLQEIRVPIVRLDDRIARAERVEFIKLDLEGYDFRGMQGGERVLKSSRPPVIFENSRAWAAQKHRYTARGFFGFFDRIGYDIWDLHNRPLTPETWDEEDMCFEFLALSRGDARTDVLRGAIQTFWTSLDRRPVLTEWRDAVRACVAPIDYVNAWN